MAGEGEVRPRRLTVSTLVHRFDVQALADADEVTMTSIARQCGDVRPGSLFVPIESEQTLQACRAAIFNGAYAILLPAGHVSKEIAQIGVPVLTSTKIDTILGPIASYMAGDPSKAIAVFVVLGEQCEEIAMRLGQLLHHLGNPIGFVGKDGSLSLGRRLETHGRLNAARLQFLQSVMVEDGVTALVIAASHGSLDPHALAGTQIDVLYDPSVKQKAYDASATTRLPHIPSLHRPDDITRSSLQMGTAVIPGTHAPVFGANLPPSASVCGTGVDVPDADMQLLEEVINVEDSSMMAAVQMAMTAGISAKAIARAESVAREFEPDDETGQIGEQTQAQPVPSSAQQSSAQESSSEQSSDQQSSPEPSSTQQQKE